MKFKGPAFPSWYQDPKPEKTVLVWTPGTQSTRERLRNMRKMARHIIDSKDPEINRAGDRVLTTCMDEPGPEFTALHLMCAAVKMAEETKQPWTVCMHTIMDTFQQHAREATDAAPDAPRQEASRIRRLLRAFTPRAFRARHESAPAVGQHQRASASTRGPQSEASVSAHHTGDDYCGVAVDEESPT